MSDSTIWKIGFFVAFMVLLGVIGQGLHAIECWINPVQLSCM